MEEHDATTAVGFHKQDPGGFQNTANLVARTLMNLELPFGLQALQGGQRHQGFLGEHLLLPFQQGSRGPNLSAGDHS
jgi:hypothetical protein